jgi:hypothetical protein
VRKRTRTGVFESFWRQEDQSPENLQQQEKSSKRIWEQKYAQAKRGYGSS